MQNVLFFLMFITIILVTEWFKWMLTKPNNLNHRLYTDKKGDGNIGADEPL